MTAATSPNMLCLAYFRRNPDIGAAEIGSARTEILADLAEIDRFDILDGTARPAAFTMPGEMELTSPDAPELPYDGAIVLQGPDSAVRKALGGRLASLMAVLHPYRVSEKVIFDKPAEAGSPDQAIRFLLSVKWFEDLPESAVRRSWQVHEALAERVHVGSNRYVQWWVHESLDPGAPELGGIVEMGFPDEKALVTGFFDSERGEMEIVQDSAHFIAGGHPRVFVTPNPYRRTR